GAGVGAYQVGAVLVVVNGHESVAAHPYGIGGGGGVGGAGAAVGLEFVAEVVHVSAGEVEGQVGVERIGQALVEGLEEGCGRWGGGWRRSRPWVRSRSGRRVRR